MEKMLKRISKVCIVQMIALAIISFLTLPAICSAATYPGSSTGTIIASVSCSAVRPSLNLSYTKAYWASYSDYVNRTLSVDYKINNAGVDQAYNVQIAGMLASYGVADLSSLPLSLGNISGGLAASFTLEYAIPEGMASFQALVVASAQDSCGNSYDYPNSQVSYIVIAQTDLMNAAKAEEIYFAAHQTYTYYVSDLVAVGFHQSPNVTFRIPIANNRSYCLEDYHTYNYSMVWHQTNYLSSPMVGACPSG